VDVLAEAFAKAILSNQDLRLILLGSGSHADRIKSILADRDVQKRVRFVGHVSYGRLMPWYRAADVFVSPSHIDGSSVSLMEALACGLPALVSDIPANREWVREGINGWLFPDGDADALAGRLLEIAHKPSSLPALGRNSRRIAEKRADWRRNFRVLLRTYERAAAKH
jgi:glycosyltransferase involved in cell wall biosynthesis